MWITRVVLALNSLCCLDRLRY